MKVSIKSPLWAAKLFASLMLLFVSVKVVRHYTSQPVHKMEIVVDGPMPLYEQEVPALGPDNKIKLTLHAGARGKVVRISHGKDCEVFEVQLKDGTSGYVINGDKFHTVEPSPDIK